LRTKPRCGPYAADAALARRLAAAQREAAERPQHRFVRDRVDGRAPLVASVTLPAELQGFKGA
jgi:hypothetical protein